MELYARLASAAFEALTGILPLAAILAGFWWAAIRTPLPHACRILTGAAYVVAGMVLFLVGLEMALFPLGRVMAEQLIAAGIAGGAIHWTDFGWVYVFALTVGFAAAIAEPALIAVATKAREVSGGAVSVWGLRVAVAAGVGVGVALGTFRIVTGLPLPWFIGAGYLAVMVLTLGSGRTIVPLAYDSGGVSTSTVTVPVVTALGIGLASAIPGRSPLIDGFGLIAFACLFPILAVLGYVRVELWIKRWRRRKGHEI